MDRLDEFEDSRNLSDRPMSRPASGPRRTHRWIGPVLGALIGFVLGSAISFLSAAYLPEGSAWFAPSGLLFQVVGAIGGGLIGLLASRRQPDTQS